jgi:hypothetical protein
VSLIDVAPTLLALAGVPAPPDFEGRVLPGIAGASAQAPAPGERALFAEHEQRVGVIHGERYYARDRDPAGSGESGLPARTATLSGGGGAPAYGSPTRPAIEPLETALADFLARGPATRDETPGPIPEEVRERMRALGYLAD